MAGSSASTSAPPTASCRASRAASTTWWPVGSADQRDRLEPGWSARPEVAKLRPEDVDRVITPWAARSICHTAASRGRRRRTRCSPPGIARLRLRSMGGRPQGRPGPTVDVDLQSRRRHRALAVVSGRAGTDERERRGTGQPLRPGRQWRPRTWSSTGWLSHSDD